MRQLTTRFTSYRIAQYEKKTGKGVMDLLDVGNLEVNKIARFIYTGNAQMKEEEEAYDRLDDYLAADPDHSLITAFFDLIDELDLDLKIMKSCGVKVSDIKDQFKQEVENSVNGINFKNRKALAEQVANDVEAVEVEDKPELTVVK